jgi:hypothetical protein
MRERADAHVLLVAPRRRWAAALVVATVAFTRTSTPGASAQAETTAAPSGRAGARARPRRPNRLRGSGASSREPALFGGSGSGRRIFARYRSLPRRSARRCRVALRDGRRAPSGSPPTAIPPAASSSSTSAWRRSLRAGPRLRRAAWRQALARDPNVEAAVRLKACSHPSFAPGGRRSCPSFDVPPRCERFPPQQLAALDRGSRAGGVRGKLALRRRAAAAWATGLGGARVRGAGAARAGRRRGSGRRRGRPLLEGKPAAAFSRLGPLARAFRARRASASTSASSCSGSGQLHKAAGAEARLCEGKTTVLGRTSRQFLGQLPAK